MKTPILALASGLFAITASAASALPVVNAHQIGVENTQMTEQVDLRRGYGFNKRTHHRNRNFSRLRDNDSRYSQYNGWHRYNHRPSRWSNRGCVSVGPIWFCP